MAPPRTSSDKGKGGKLSSTCGGRRGCLGTRGIMFYGTTAYPGQLHFSCHLEPSSSYNANCISLIVSPYQKLRHLAREASQYLVLLLRARLESFTRTIINYCCTVKLTVVYDLPIASPLAWEWKEASAAIEQLFAIIELAFSSCDERWQNSLHTLPCDVQTFGPKIDLLWKIGFKHI